MKQLITLIASLILYSANAQDTLVLTNGTKLGVKIIEEGKSSVKYKVQTTNNAVVHEIKKEKIHLIKFENGTSLALSALNVGRRTYDKRLFGSNRIFEGENSGNSNAYRGRGSNCSFFNAFALLFINIGSCSRGGLFFR